MDPMPQTNEAATDRQVGSGWISGVFAFLLAGVGLGAVLCVRYPGLLTMPDARPMYNVALIRLALHVVLILGFLLGVVSIVLRKQKILGFSALAMILLATVLGGSHAESRDLDSDVYLGLDWFLLNLLFTSILFIPIERLFGRREQPIFRFEWREDLLYFTISSLMVQGLTYLSLAPSMAILKHTEWLTEFRASVASQPIVLQFLEIMFLTDLVQYWVHRLFHRVPMLWKFHSVHHSAQTMDWLAGSRMHVMEIVILRGATVLPMYVLGFAEGAMYAYIFFVYLFSTIVHANLRIDFGFLKYWFVTPLYHHWHHGIEREAIDVNFAVHFPILDKIFGTFYLPEDEHWPTGYGIGGHPVPKGFLRQFLYPFVRENATPTPATENTPAPSPSPPA